MVATLALVNMIFRGDGSSNIVEGDSLNMQLNLTPDKVLMNPPFALEHDYEWKFVDKALAIMKEGGVLFAILPTSSMLSADDSRGEVTWRKQLLNRHRLVAVIKMPELLFKPVMKGTYGVIIEAHRSHRVESHKVIFAVLDDGHTYSKTQKKRSDNLKSIRVAVGNYLATGTEPEYIPKVIDCRTIDDLNYDFSPEGNIGGGESDILECNWGFVERNLCDAHLEIMEKQNIEIFKNCGRFPLSHFFCKIHKGKSGRNVDLQSGTLPLISTSERLNGISSFVNKENAKALYPPNKITISSNGGSCCAFFHDYEFAANADVYVCHLKIEFCSKEIGLFICSSINNEKWRFNYYRKFNKTQLNNLKISMPIDDTGIVDLSKIKNFAKNKLNQYSTVLISPPN